MNMESLFTSLTEMFPNGILSRTKTHGNFIAVEGEVVDGVQTYYAVKPIALLAKSNDRYEAFNLENAHAEYLEFVANQEAKANKPKKTKGVDPVKVAAKEKRMNDLLEYLKSHANVAYTASELFTAIPQYNLDGLSNMAVGSDLVALMHTDENLSYETDTAKKKHWTYNM